MSSEPDCTASSGGFVLESSLSSIISSHRKGNSNTINSDKISNNNNEDTDCDLEKSVCASSNNNNFNVNNNNLTSATGSVTSNGSLKNSGTSNNSYASATSAIASTNFLNDNSNSDGKFNTLKCERCDNFETISHALLLVHVAQCRGDINSGTSRQFAIDANAESGTDNDGTMDGTVSVTASSTVLHNSTSDSLQLKQNADGNVNNGNAAQRKLFECDVCNMKFSNGANMRRHKMRHTGVKPYECRVCQKRFFRKDHLAEHFTTHTKTLPYHCPICNRGFQRQIAMRAHFQNEHVGQNDLVKTCPLCNYRAGTMKSLRIHFFNRHGIDLDNPGPNAPSSLLLALDPSNASSYLPSIALAAAAAAAAANSSNLSSLSGNNGGNSNSGPSYSDSGDSLQDSLRSTENGTPPMHFLTPHVEISMADNDTYKSEPMATSINSALEIQPCATTISRPSNGGSPSPHSADSNSNMPSSSQSIIGNALQNSRSLHHDGQITPSISLIPIKQEPSSDDYDMSKSMRQQNADQQSTSNSISANSAEHNATSSSSLTSLIKVSPLKSLLREDLKRRISARATNRATRNSNNNSNINNNNGTSSSANSTASTSSSSSFSKSSNNASSITNTINAINQHLLSNSSITVTTESTTTTTGSYNGTAPRSPLGSVATTSNGAITSTGASETELLLAAVSSGHRGKRMLQCQFCGIDFPDQTLYFLHKGCHSDSNAWKCNICGEQCNNVYEFNSHLLSKSHQ